MKTGSIAAAFLLIAAGAAAAETPKPTAPPTGRIDLGAMSLRVGLSPPVISPDGSRVVVSASRANFEENRYERTLLLIDVKTGAQRTLADAAMGAGQPEFSPGGDKLAWLASGEGGTSQVFVLSLADAGARPVQLTHSGTGVATHVIGYPAYAWSPDGQWIGYVASDARKVADGEERHNVSFEVVDNDYMATEATRSFRLWVVPSSGGEARQLQSGAGSVAGFGWHRDSKSIAYVSQPSPHNNGLDYAEFMFASSRMTSLKSVDLAGVARPDIIPAESRVLSPPTASPNGEYFAFQHFTGREPWNHPTEIAIVPAAGGEPRSVTQGLDRDIGDFDWLPDGKSIVMSAPDGTRIGLWQQPLGGAARRLELGAVVEFGGLSVSKTGAIAFVGSEAAHGAELYVMSSIDTLPRRITRFNDALSSFELGRTEIVRWKQDGFDEAGILTYPPGYKAGQKVPLVLHIHGGPEGTSTDAFDLFDQVMAAKGWAIFEPNYRGSNSQGAAFQTAVVNDLGDGPGRDVMAGLAAVKQLGIVDEDRIAVSGWSYGGYMTAWMIGHYQGWRAAVVGAPLVNMVDWYVLSCCNAWADPVAGGSPFTNGNFENYWRQSPLTYAANVKTPTLILQRKGDAEAPYTQSFNLYHALRDNGVEVQFILYPLDGHGYTYDPIHERDTYRRWMGWIEEHFR